MNLRGQAAIVGIGEVPTRRSYPGQTTVSLMAEAVRLALADAHLLKTDIDGLITNAGGGVNPTVLAEYVQIRPVFTEGVNSQGASGAQSIVIAASAIMAGLCNTVLCVLGGSRTLGGGAAAGRSVGSEWETPFGPGAATTARYALLKQRHMFEFGSKDEQFARMAANQRFNALTNPNAAFQGQPISVQDVLDSRYVSEPIHLLETVMPCDGAAAAIVTSAARATSFATRPVYVLGAGAGATNHDVAWQDPDMTTTPVAITARRAFEMARYGPQDIQFAEFYDCYTVLEAMCLEDAGFCKKGEIGEFFESTDTTYKGPFPVNTDGGQLSGGQPAGNSGGFRHVIEAARQIMGKAGERQIPRSDLCAVNG